MMPIDNAVCFTLVLFALLCYFAENESLKKDNDRLKKRIDELKQELYVSRNCDDCEPNHWNDFRLTD